MIKIKKAYTDFMKSIFLGQRAYCIELDSFGYEDNEENVAIVCASFPLVYIYGEEPFKQNKSISELCSFIQKSNPYTKIIIETDGFIRPSGMNNIKNIQYFIRGKSKKSGISFEKRINENSWKWLSKAGGFFIFPIIEEDDFEEINTIISALMIRKHQIYIDIQSNDFQHMAFLTINYGFNIYIDNKEEWIENEETTY